MPNSHWVGTWTAAPAEGVVGFNNHTKSKHITHPTHRG
jgi:hypothetical protein